MRCAVAFAIVTITVAQASAAGCPAPTSVVLASSASDRDVFVWDSRVRLADYASGQWENTRAVFAHTILARQGTRAVIVTCPSSGAQDAIAVKVVSGPHRGRYGWVLPTDVHIKTTIRG